MRKVAIYARVSTEEQAKVEEGSIKNQVSGMEKYVEGENLKEGGSWGVIVGIYKDEGFSGKSLERPEIKRLLKDISKHKIDTVIITEISRMSRSVRDWIDLRSFFEENDAAFISVRQRFDTSNAMGRAMLNFAIEFAQLEREITAERVKVSYQARANRGLWPGGPVPFGFDLTPDRPGHLQVNAAKKIIADEILDTFLNKAGSVSKTVSLLKEAGYKRDRGLEWDDSSLIRWIRHRSLVGELEVNKKVKNKSQGKLPEGERYKIVKTVWSPIVDPELWTQANALLDENYRKLKVNKWKHHEFLLTGLIECPKGVRLIGGSGWGRSGKKYVQYKHLKKCGCHFSSIPADDMEKVVLKRIRSLSHEPPVIAELTEKANRKFYAEQPDYKDSILALKRRLEGTIRKLDKIMDQILDAESPEEKQSWMEKAQRLQGEKKDVEYQLHGLKGRAENKTDALLDPEAIHRALVKFNDGFDQLPIAARQSLLKSILDKIEVQKDEIILHVKNPGFDPTNKKVPGIDCDPGDYNLVYRSKWGD